MDQQIKRKFPEWCSDNKSDYSLCLSDDADSLLSCCLLKHLFEYPIEWFYNFTGIGCVKNPAEGLPVGVDMDIVKGRAWANHVRGIENPDCANLNNDIGLGNYFDKYSGSTLLEIMSFYGINVNQYNEEARMLLMCLDGFYVSFYPKKIDFSGTQKKWLKLMGYPQLIDIMAKHKKHEFEDLISKYRLYEKIYMVDGILQTDIDLEGLSRVFKFPVELPKEKFYLDRSFHNVGMNINDYYKFKNELAQSGGKIFSQAITNKNFIKMSYEI